MPACACEHRGLLTTALSASHGVTITAGKSTGGDENRDGEYGGHPATSGAQTKPVKNHYESVWCATDHFFWQGAVTT